MFPDNKNGFIEPLNKYIKTTKYKKLFGRNFFRAVIFLPAVLSVIAISLTFMLVLNPEKGPVNNFLISWIATYSLADQ
jgi:ABC-type sugar transport system permease subunit